MINTHRTGGGGALLVLMLAGLAGCAGRPSLPEPDSFDAQLYKEKCGHCHKPRKPGLYYADRWEYVVDHMADQQMLLLQPAEQEIILNYLKRHSRF